VKPVVSLSWELFRRRILYLVVSVMAAAMPFGIKQGIILYQCMFFGGEYLVNRLPML
jgi:hypothetical protein